MYRAASVDNGDEAVLELQSSTSQAVEQLIADLLILRGSLMESKNRLGPRLINPQRHDEVFAAVLHPVDHQCAQIDFR